MLKETVLAESIARISGKILVDNLGKINSRKEKSPKNFVTNVDLASEKLIISEIKKKYPTHQILSEEAGEKKTNSQYKWIIDPLDGTHNYMHSFPLFGVSIAVEHKGEVVSAVINVPLLNRMYVAEKGKGSYLNGKRIHVSKTNSLYHSLIVMDSLFDRYFERLTELLEKISPLVNAIRFPGAAIMDLSSVAVGEADAYICIHTNPWDVAAGMLLIKEAGGKITDYSGKPVDHYARNFIATNSLLHNAVLKALK